MNASTKVLHVCDTVIGGTGSYLAELLAHQLVTLGPDRVRLIMPQQHLPFLESSLIDAGLRTEVFNRPSRLRGLVRMTRLFFRVAGEFKPDIVHAHSSGAGVVLRTLRSAFRSKLIFCPHGWAFDIPSNPLGSRAVRQVERVLASRADRIVAISPHEYARAIEVGIPEDRLILIANGINRLPPQTSPAAWDDDRIKLLFAGRFDHQKGLDVLLKAIEPLGERVSVRVIGQSVVSRKSARPPTPPHVEMYGWRDRTQVTAQMMAADLLVVPSRWEGFGLVAIEAMRLSLPVAASAVGGLLHVLDLGRAGILFAPDDPLALRACLEGITREQLARLRAIGHQRFLDHFTADRMVAEVDALYRNVLAAR